MVAHSLGVREVGRSNRLAPTNIARIRPDVSSASDRYLPFILIPAYEAERTIESVVTTLRSVCSLSILVIDDGSHDRTSVVARQAGADVITLSSNQGKGNALKNGMGHALHLGYTHALCIDADGQHSAEEIDRFLHYSPNAIIVIGVREFAAPMPMLRRLSNTLTSLVLSISTGQFIPDSQSGYRRYHLASVCAWPLLASRFDYETEVLFAAGRMRARVESVPVSTHYGDEQSSIQGGREILQFLFQFWKFLWR